MANSRAAFAILLRIRRAQAERADALYCFWMGLSARATMAQAGSVN